MSESVPMGGSRQPRTYPKVERPDSVVVGVVLAIVMIVVSLFFLAVTAAAVWGGESSEIIGRSDAEGTVKGVLAVMMLLSVVGLVAAAMSLRRSDGWHKVLVGLTAGTLLLTIVNLASGRTQGSGTAVLVNVVWAVGAITVMCLLNSARAKAWFDDPFGD